jgi:RNA polymerase sigma-70 factor (ECF subfamily)
VARYAARRIPSDEIHDVVAETFLTAWRRMNDVPDDALPWLLGTARHHIANRRRSSRRRQALDRRLVDGAVESPEYQPEISDVDERLVEAIKRLPTKEREALMLVAWDGLDPRRAARAVGCSSGAFRVRLHRARSRIKRELDASFPAPAPHPLPHAQTEDLR